MHRATGNNTSLRSFASSGRATADKMDDNKLMQEASGSFMKNESRTAVESPQNYGFTSHNHSKDDSGSAECHVSFVGGNRAHPVAGNMDDRRHRLRGLAEGDTAMHRGKDDDQQIHLASDGMYHSAPQMVRVQLVPSGSAKANAPQSKAQAPAAKQAMYAQRGPHIEARLWAGLEPELQLQLDIELDRLEGRERPGVTPFAESGGAGSSGGGGANGGGSGQQKNKPTGQKAVSSAGKDSKDFMHVKKGEGRLSSASKVRLSTGKEDSDVLHESGSGKDYVGGTPAKHKFSKILTLAGPSVNGYAKIG